MVVFKSQLTQATVEADISLCSFRT